MAGYREFQTGEVLTAANVNSFLMEQATMTFADAAARDAALAGVLREGLLTYNLDTNRLEVYDGTDWVEPAPEPPAGIGSNVVQTVKTDTFATTSSSYVDIAGLTLSITPSTATSKILLLASFTMHGARDGFGAMAAFYRGSTELTVGDASGSRQRAHSGIVEASDDRPLYQIVMHLLDSPSTTSATTYSVRVKRTGGTLIIGQSKDNTGNNLTTVSTITAIEVAP